MPARTGRVAPFQGPYALAARVMVAQGGTTIQRQLMRQFEQKPVRRSVGVRTLSIGRFRLPTHPYRGVPIQGEPLGDVSQAQARQGVGIVTAGKAGAANVDKKIELAKGKAYRKRTIVEAGGDGGRGGPGVSMGGDATRPTKRLAPDALAAINCRAGL